MDTMDYVEMALKVLYDRIERDIRELIENGCAVDSIRVIDAGEFDMILTQGGLPVVRYTVNLETGRIN